MPEKLDTDEITEADAAVRNAQTVRSYHRKRSRRGNAQRETDIKLALDRLAEAMKPLRSQIGRFPYGPQTDKAEANRQVIYEASRRIQSERRKLWKMQKR